MDSPDSKEARNTREQSLMAAIESAQNVAGATLDIAFTNAILVRARQFEEYLNGSS